MPRKRLTALSLDGSSIIPLARLSLRRTESGADGCGVDGLLSLGSSWKLKVYGRKLLELAGMSVTVFLIRRTVRLRELPPSPMVKYRLDKKKYDSGLWWTEAFRWIRKLSPRRRSEEVEVVRS